MNLAEANALSMLAKAGRQKITEKHKIVAHPELHKVLSYQGFKILSTKPGQSQYHHPRTGAKATVTDKGDWHVTYPKPKEMNEPVDKKMKVAAGGPGSGRYPKGSGSGLPMGSLKKAAWAATRVAKQTGSKANHQKAYDLHNEYVDRLWEHLSKRGVGYSRAAGEHDRFAEYHKSLAQGKKPSFTPARYNPKEDPASMSYRYTPSLYD